MPTGGCFEEDGLSLVRELLRATPSMPVTVIAERIGWSWSVTNLRRHVRRIRGDYLPVDPADRLDYRPGDQAQCDFWFPPVKVLACPLFSVRPDWESVGFGATAGLSVLGRRLVAKA